jgi:phage tail sheath gpL-like
MSLNATSLAAAVGVGVRNVQFQSGANNLPRKILIAATYDPAKVAVVPLVPVQVLSPEDAGDRFGFGSMAHRLALQAFLGGQGTPVYVLPQEEAGGAVVAAGAIDFTTSAAVVAGTIYVYIAGVAVPVVAAALATPATLATALVAAITANKLLPVTAEVDGVIPGKVNVTAKSKGPWGNKISLKVNLGVGQVLPSGVVCAITAMAAGAGVPVMATALAALGTQDDANEDFFTELVHGYGQDATTLDAISDYVGAGNDFMGLYSKTVGRPFRSLTGDVATGSAGLTALIVISDGRKLDRANGIISVPGSASHPAEIAAQTLGHMARINCDRVAQHYLGVPLIGIHTGAKVDRWNANYDSRDTAVKSGVSPVRIQNGVVTLQNVVSFYRPDNVPAESNGYRSMRNIAIIQNLLYNIRLNFEQEKWQGISIVADVTKVSTTTDRQKARDTSSVIDDLVALAKSFEDHAWIYEAAFTINRLKVPGAVTIRPGGLGFNNVLSVIFSGEGGILDTIVEFDTSLAVLLNQ